MSTTRYALGWLLATVLVTLAAWWVVAAASGEVNAVSGAPLIVPTTSTSRVEGSPSSTSTTVATTSSTSTPGTTSSTSTPGSTSSTSAPADTSTTTSTESPSGVETIPSPGGTVTVSFGNGGVNLQGASPAFGYAMEVKDSGPDRVRVDFESDDGEISVRVEWKDGMLDIDITG